MISMYVCMYLPENIFHQKEVSCTKCPSLFHTLLMIIGHIYINLSTRLESYIHKYTNIRVKSLMRVTHYTQQHQQQPTRIFLSPSHLMWSLTTPRERHMHTQQIQTDRQTHFSTHLYTEQVVRLVFHSYDFIYTLVYF